MMQRFLRTMTIGALLVLGGGGCQSPPAAPEAAAIPDAQGFQPVIDSSNLIFVIPVEGVNGAGALVLADAVAASLRDARKPAILASKANELGPTVVGVVTDTEKRGSVVWVTAAWELQDRDGVPVESYRHQVVVDEALWRAGAAEAINLLAMDAGDAVTAMVRRRVVAAAGAPSPPAPAAPVRLEPGPPAPALAAAPGTAPGAAPPETGRSLAAAVAPYADTPSIFPRALSAPPAARPAVSSPASSPGARVAALTAEPESPPPPPPSPVVLAPPKPITEAVAVAKRPAPKKPKPVIEKRPAPRPKAKKTAHAEGLKPVPPPDPKAKPQAEARAKPKPVLMPVPEDAAGRVVADPPPVQWGRPSFLIKPVTGVNDAANQALMRAMKEALRKRDLTVTEDPRQAGYVIAGTVDIGPAVAGRQRAKIVWVVNTIDGDEVGKAVQENAVQAGSLDGAWGRVADIVSNAAVVGIQELFGIDEKQSTKLHAPPFNPDHPALPRLPGRAPPPPE